MKHILTVLAMFGLSLSTALSYAAGVIVPNNASGGFGDPNTGFAPLVVGRTFSGSETVVFEASGVVNTFNGMPGFDTPPDGDPGLFFTSISTILPLEEAAADANPAQFAFPRMNVTLKAGLMAAFIPNATASNPAFEAVDEDLVGLGIDADALFRPNWSTTQLFSFTAPEAGVLFFGVNDSRVDNNEGAYEVSVVPLPPSAFLLMVPLMVLGALRSRRRIRRAP
ncbi:MAG: hypothetical protein AAF493_00805 [Pseudomonadota bacterium]